MLNDLTIKKNDKENIYLGSLSKINIILGKNSSGKSNLLRGLEKDINDREINYVPPEKGGFIAHDAHVETVYARGTGAYENNFSPTPNQSTAFRKISHTKLKQFYISFLQDVHHNHNNVREDLNYTFETKILDHLNTLLTYSVIRLVVDALEFKFFDRQTGELLKTENLSSGELELSSLGIEILTFIYKKNVLDKGGILLLDEPDVHLHPDAQHKLIQLLIDAVEKNNKLQIIIATHSTAILGAVSYFCDAKVSFMSRDTKELQFENIDTIQKDILPIFGAHPLSQAFNEMPILIVEGDDNQRIWNQAIRSSKGILKVYPCTAGVDGKAGNGEINKYEIAVDKIAMNVYDHPKAFSLRDGDENALTESDLHPKGCVTPLKLACYASENLLLSDEVIQFTGKKYNCDLTWPKIKENIDKWLEINTQHSHYNNVLEFRNKDYNRREFNLKKIRNLLLVFIESALNEISKPDEPISLNLDWEVLIGKTIGTLLLKEDKPCVDISNSILTYLGINVVSNLLPSLKNESKPS